MLFMVIERFREPAAAVYERARERGRMAPEGLTYVNSWVDVGLRRCFQLMECEDAALLASWVAAWSDFVEFEVVPVITSAETAAIFAEP
jgi:hypothetical protein